jgi:hypothetical protein
MPISKTFTVKDFINHNAPCFGCGKPVVLQMQMFHNEPWGQDALLNCKAGKNFLTIDLSLRYHDFLKLTIDYKTNHFATNNFDHLTKFLSDCMLKLVCHCDACKTTMHSNILDFNLEKKFIKPFGIQQEIIVMSDSKNMYQVYSDYDQNKSVIFIDDVKMANVPIRLDTPLIPRFKFKNKEKLIEKLKTYALFS